MYTPTPTSSSNGDIDDSSNSNSTVIFGVGCVLAFAILAAIICACQRLGVCRKLRGKSSKTENVKFVKLKEHEKIDDSKRKEKKPQENEENEQTGMTQPSVAMNSVKISELVDGALVEGAE